MPQRNTPSAIILRALAQFLSLSVLVTIPVLVVYLDIAVLQNGLSEQSLTEYSEQLLLSATVFCYLYVIKINPSFRRFGALVVGFFLCMLIRELDLFFDQMMWHGFWAYPATIIAASAILYALGDRKETLREFAAFVSHPHFVMLCLGMAMLLVFSRLFGMSELWRDALGHGYVRTAKNIAEEGTELMAYITILFASFRYALSARKARLKAQKHVVSSSNYPL